MTGSNFNFTVRPVLRAARGVTTPDSLDGKINRRDVSKNWLGIFAEEGEKLNYNFILSWVRVIC